jgi:peptide-methionine (R)-S-oxide reductase
MTQNLTRRAALLGACTLPLIACSGSAIAEIPSAANEARYTHSPFRGFTADQWRQRLSPDAFHILREEGTERPGTSPLLNEHRAGAFVCAGCDLPLFRSTWKFDSGTGWPSFFNCIETNLATRVDRQLMEERTEYHCAQCLGHQGHVFPDGPPPTHLRYCNDGAGLKFVPA